LGTIRRVHKKKISLSGRQRERPKKREGGKTKVVGGDKGGGTGGLITILRYSERSVQPRTHRRGGGEEGDGKEGR